MGKHLAHSRTPLDEIAPTSIKYSLAKRIAIAEDVAAGYSYREVASRHGVALATIHAAVKSPDIQEIIDPQIVETRRKRMAAIYEYQADMALSTLTRERWEKERPSSVMISSCAATDKSRLLRGESTENVSVRGIVESFSTELLELRKKREQLFSNQQQNGHEEKSANLEDGKTYPQENIGIAEITNISGQTE